MPAATRCATARGAGVVVALAAALTAGDADALVVARVTRHGYVLVDEPGAASVYGGRVPPNDPGLLQLAGDATAAIDAVPGAPRGRYLAVIQVPTDTTTRGSYTPVRNDVRGIGSRSSLGGSEVFDSNLRAGTRFPLTGVVFLNSLGFFTRAADRDLTRNWVCPQEFGHRFGVHVRVPPRPGDAGAAPDASADADADHDAATDAAGDAPEDAMDAVDAATRPLAADALLGRQAAHWSYFVNSGGSPMEGNAWEEVAPGVFQTAAPSRRFSPLDLYLMGLVPASAVPPSFVIAEPDVMGQSDIARRPLARESPPELTGRRVMVRGRRVPFTVEDVIRANGVRVPAWRDPDAGPPPADAGTDDGRALDVIWVMLATQATATAALADDFDRAVELCTDGYAEAAEGRSRLVAVVAAGLPDAGAPDADAGADDATADTASAPDAATADGPRAPTAPASGCGCATPRGDRRGAAPAAALAALVAGVARRRRRRATASER